MRNETFRPDLLKGKNAFIAGGSSGINLGIAKKLGVLGAQVFLMSRSQDKIDAAIQDLREFGISAAGCAADVRDYAAVESAVQRCVEVFGPLDIVVSGAAGNFVAPAAELSSNGFKTVVDIDLNGTFHVCGAAYAHVRKPQACMLNISAVQAFMPVPGQAHVCAAKAGVEALTKVLAIEWGPQGIRVNAIAPGPVEGTEGMARLTPTAKHKARFLKAIPLRRYAELDEIADTAAFLCSPAGSNFNGEVLVCDGGQSTLGGGGFAAAWSG